MTMRRPLLFGSILAAALACSSAARAQVGAAEALFDQGRQALAAGDLETACAKLRASEQLDPAAGTRANLATCEERRGRVATAWAMYRSALDKLPPGDARVAAVQERVKKMEARLPRLVLTLAPGAANGTTVLEGDAKLGDAATYGVPLPLDPGLHHLVVTAPGRLPRNIDATLAEGETTALTVESGAPAGATAPPGLTPSPTASGRHADDEPPLHAVERSSPGPWIAGGIGVAALVVGAVTGALVIQNKGVADAHCTFGPPATCRDQTGMNAASAVRTLGPVTTVSLVVGAAGLATGAIWLGVRRTDTSSMRIGIGPAPGGAAWRLEGSW